MPKPFSDISLISPELVVAAIAFAVLVADLVFPRAWRKEIALLAGLGLVAALLPTASLWGRGPVSEFSGAFLVDNLALALKLLFTAAGAMTVLMSADYFMGLRKGFGEYFALLCFFVLALCFMASAGDLIVLYIAFELSSITGYLLAAWLRDDPKSNEAGLKYFIYGAAASGVMLFGISLLYGLTGTLEIRGLADRLAANSSVLGGVAAAMVLAGLGYKIAMWPFHWWAPDVYEGAPTPVTAFLSVGPKIAGLALIVRVMAAIQASAPDAWPAVIALLAIITMFTGNLLAIRQANVKRMLAYSSIAHAGYLLIGVVVAWFNPTGLQALVFYAVVYVFMNLGAFAVALIVEAQSGNSLIESFAGLAQRAPVLAAAMTVFLLSLTGIPPTGGFVGKLLLFGAAISVPKLWLLALAGIVNTAISLYYYMNIARAMFLMPAGEERLERVPGALTAALVVAIVAVLAMGVAPQALTVVAEVSSRALASL
ncbi:MAG: NADH-quinone oxidoreductase subunit N [Armatimonadetes bacterium]|nr:NADH-quinone oxidoreductase subunit N [Armatimonadota bacterium]